MPGGVDQYGMQQMMEMMKQVEKDPELKRQMEGYWKMLDNMNEQNPEAYKKFIDQQMGEMKEHQTEEQKAEALKNTINSDPYFSFSVRPSKLVDSSKPV